MSDPRSIDDAIAAVSAAAASLEAIVGAYTTPEQARPAIAIPVWCRPGAGGAR